MTPEDWLLTWQSKGWVKISDHQTSQMLYPTTRWWTIWPLWPVLCCPVKWEPCWTIPGLGTPHGLQKPWLQPQLDRVQLQLPLAIWVWCQFCCTLLVFEGVWGLYTSHVLFWKMFSNFFNVTRNIQNIFQNITLYVYSPLENWILMGLVWNLLLE